MNKQKLSIESYQNQTKLKKKVLRMQIMCFVWALNSWHSCMMNVQTAMAQSVHTVKTIAIGILFRYIV